MAADADALFMELEQRRSKRVMAVMPEEEPVYLQADGKEYAAKLVNITSGGALVSVLECTLEPSGGTPCKLFFSTEDAMFGVKSQVLRKNGRYAAFRFVDMTAETALEIAGKIARMEKQSATLCPRITFVC